MNYVITPGRFIGLADEEDDFDFGERFTALKIELKKQIKEEAELNDSILKMINIINVEENA
jgi:type I restriction enzyme M protein